MEDFRNYLEKKNMKEIQIFLKNNSVDLLKSIAKKYKLPASTKKKELIIQDILQAVESEKPFPMNDPPIHLLTINQLRNKAKQLNIDYSSMKLKQDLRMAILQKMESNKSGKQVEDLGLEESIKELQSKTLPYLKTLAKSYKIKVSKLSKNQLITLILEAQSSETGRDKPTTIDLSDKDVSKMKKNELILKASQLGLETKSKSKAELIKTILAHEGMSSSSSSFPTENQEVVVTTITLPISEQQEKDLMKDRKMTVKKIQELLKNMGVDVPKKITKRSDLIHFMYTYSEPGQSSSSSLPSTPKRAGKKKTTKTKQDSPDKEMEVEHIIELTTSPKNDRQEEDASSSEDEIEKTDKRPHLRIDTDIVALDDIESPFSPVAIGELLEEPTEKELQDELYRCLQYYEYPSK